MSVWGNRSSGKSDKSDSHSVDDQTVGGDDHTASASPAEKVEFGADESVRTADRSALRSLKNLLKP